MKTKKNKTCPEWFCYIDVSHRQTMEHFGLGYEDLTPSIQQAIIELEEVYLLALSDGVIDQKESTEIMTRSFRISERIVEQMQPRDTDNTGGVVLGIFATLGIVAGAVFGIRSNL